jgi:hypothetical protein
MTDRVLNEYITAYPLKLLRTCCDSARSILDSTTKILGCTSIPRAAVGAALEKAFDDAIKTSLFSPL